MVPNTPTSSATASSATPASSCTTPPSGTNAIALAAPSTAEQASSNENKDQARAVEMKKPSTPRHHCSVLQQVTTTCGCRPTTYFYGYNKNACLFWPYCRVAQPQKNKAAEAGTSALLEPFKYAHTRPHHEQACAKCVIRQQGIAKGLKRKALGDFVTKEYVGTEYEWQAQEAARRQEDMEACLAACTNEDFETLTNAAKANIERYANKVWYTFNSQLDLLHQILGLPAPFDKALLVDHFGAYFEPYMTAQEKQRLIAVAKKGGHGMVLKNALKKEL